MKLFLDKNHYENFSSAMKNDLMNLIGKLPSQPGILGSRNYFRSAVLIPFVKRENEYHLLFEKRADHIRQGGEVSFPGGGFDPEVDRKCSDAAIRETCEELGLQPSDITIHKQFDTVVVPHGNMIFTFPGEISAKSFESIRINPQEVEYIFTIPVNFFMENEPEIYQTRSQMFPSKIDEDGNEQITFPAEELGVPAHYAKPWGSKLHPVYVYRFKNEIIWGITAHIIYELMLILKK